MFWFVYAVVWTRTISFYFTILTCDLQDLELLGFIQYIFYYKFFGHKFIILSTYVEACFVEEWIDSFPIFNLNFSPLHLIFDLWSHLKKRKNFWECFVLSNELLTVPWFILFWFLASFPVIKEYGYFLW